MTKAIRWLLNGEDRLIDKIDKRKKVDDIRRGSTKKGRVIRTSTGVIKRVIVG